jgi:phosphatidate cytidylyltransferase
MDLALSPYALTSLTLFGGVAAVLLLASTIGTTLKRAVAHGQPHAVIDNLIARVNAWWVMVAVIGAAFLFGHAGMVLLFGLISFHALREFITLLHTRRADHPAIAASFFIVLPAQYLLVWTGWYGLFSIFIPVYAFLLLPILAALGGDTRQFLERTAKVQWGLMVSVFCISHVPALVMLEIPGFEGRNLLLIAFLVIVVQGSDVLQYVWGKLFGRHLVAPVLSPSKTWEGLIGGVASATLLGAALHGITPFGPWAAAGLAFAMCVMGFLGGLVMSAIKRDRGVKDWGQLIEGHGGMLDRLDSVVFAAPVFFHLVRYSWAL